MTDNEIIKAASLPMYRQFAVAVDGQGNLIRVRDLIDVINRLNAKNDELFYKLEGVMHSVDKWLDGDELKQDEVNRAITMREKTLQIVEEKQAEIERLHQLQKPTGAGGYKIENGKVIFYSDMLNGYRHEYKDLEEIVKELNLYMHTDHKNIELISHYQHKTQTAKSEAIKEFTEELKTRIKNAVFCCYDVRFKNHLQELLRIIVAKIDNLVEEMTEL